MKFRIAEAIAVLRNTPAAIRGLLNGLPEVWTTSNEGAETWSAHDVVAHLIQGEHAAWINRVTHVLEHGETIALGPFDRTAGMIEARNRPLAELVDEFERLRTISLDRLRELDLSESDLEKTTLHPEFGRVTLAQLLATWVVHDLDHTMQIVRVMAYQYRDAVGPWHNYLRITKPAAGA